MIKVPLYSNLAVPLLDSARLRHHVGIIPRLFNGSNNKVTSGMHNKVTSSIYHEIMSRPVARPWSVPVCKKQS